MKDAARLPKCTWCYRAAEYRPKDMSDERYACAGHILQVDSQQWERFVGIARWSDEDPIGKRRRGGKRKAERRKSA